MEMYATSECIICGKKLQYSMPTKQYEYEDSGGKHTIVYAQYDAIEAWRYPCGGVCFQSLGGQFGSAIHDLDGQNWVIVICDECLEERGGKIFKTPLSPGLYRELPNYELPNDICDKLSKAFPKTREEDPKDIEGGVE